MPILVFNLLTDGNIARAVAGEDRNTGHDQDRGWKNQRLTRRSSTPKKNGEGRGGGSARPASIRTAGRQPRDVQPDKHRPLRPDDPDRHSSSINVPEARLVVIKPYEAAQLRKHRDAIRNLTSVANPSNDGNVIRCQVPQLTEERRRELVKQATRARTPGVGPQHPPQAPWRSWPASRRTATPVRGRGHPRGEGPRQDHPHPHDPDRTSWSSR